MTHKKLFMVCIMLSCFATMTYNQDSSSKSHAEIRLKTKYFDVSGEALKDPFGHAMYYGALGLQGFLKHPALTCCGAATYMLSRLYKHEYDIMSNAISTMLYEHKHVSSGIGLLVLYGLYKKKDLLQPIAPASVDEEKVSKKQEGEAQKAFVSVYKSGSIKTSFKDVIGLDNAKEDLMDIVLYLKHPETFQALGARVPKGILLSGDPGNGKTLLARAFAGEVGCPFITVSGSAFDEVFVGVGAHRVRQLFSLAKAFKSPVIIFIDEIDSIGYQRHTIRSQDTGQTLNQLLSEMDGFEQSEYPIVVIGATNRKDILDRALVRPGRFDRHIVIDAPFLEDRKKILELYCAKIKTNNHIDCTKLAHMTSGFSAADLALLINEAALLAIRSAEIEVSSAHIEQAFDNILLGKPNRNMQQSDDAYWETAVHEAGHALANVYQKSSPTLHKVSITARNTSLGVTSSFMQNTFSLNKEEVLARIVIALAGSVAEELILKTKSSGCASDLQRARALAMNMVVKYGMSETFKDMSFEQYIRGYYSEQIATQLEREIATIISTCRSVAHTILSEHVKELEQVARLLMERKTIVAAEVYAICGLSEPVLQYVV